VTARRIRGRYRRSSEVCDDLLCHAGRPKAKGNEVKLRFQLIAVVLLASAAIGLGACSSGSSTNTSSSANTAKFCSDDFSIDQLSAPNTAAVLGILKRNQALFDDLRATAPARWRVAARKIASDVDKAIATGKLTALTASDAALGRQIDAFCMKSSTP
jgi:hypothetical protein